MGSTQHRVLHTLHYMEHTPGTTYPTVCPIKVYTPLRPSSKKSCRRKTNVGRLLKTSAGTCFTKFLWSSDLETKLYTLERHTHTHTPT